MISQYENIHLPKLFTNSMYNNITNNAICPPYSTKFPNTKKLNELAEKFQNNWTEFSDFETRELDDSLTNLNWLHNVTSIMGPQSPSRSPISLLNQSALPGINIGQKNLEYVPSQAHATLTHHLDCALKDGGLLDPLVRFDYKNNWSGKPPFSYATLICMAMRELNKTKITLSDIYGWITENFIYYRLSDSSWQNSVRHNLSLNKCFEKVPRNKDERGKGGFWRINPKYADRLESNLIKYRRQFPGYGIPKISNGLPAASTILSRDQSSSHELDQIYGGQQYAATSATTDNGWQQAQYENHHTLPQIQLADLSWGSKNKDSFIPNISICNYSNVISPCAFNNSLVSHQDSSFQRKYCPKTSQIVNSHNQTQLQSLDEFRTSESGDKVDTQMRADSSRNSSPTMYSLLRQINSPPSHLSLDDLDSAASSSFDADLPGNSGSSAATYQSTSDDHSDESLRYGLGLVEDFMITTDEYIACDSYRHQDNYQLFSQYV